jgi:hypothetical protein
MVDRLWFMVDRKSLAGHRSTVNRQRFSIYCFPFSVFKIPEDEGAKMIQ